MHYLFNHCRTILKLWILLLFIAAYVVTSSISGDKHAAFTVRAEPLKKKKRLDPALVRLQTERRKKRLEKQIKRAAKFGRKLKPVDELELWRVVKDE